MQTWGQMHTEERLHRLWIQRLPQPLVLKEGAAGAQQERGGVQGRGLELEGGLTCPPSQPRPCAPPARTRMGIGAKVFCWGFLR